MPSSAPHFDSILIAIPPAQVVFFKSIVESYDNLTTIRTEDPRQSLMRLYFSPDSRDDVEAMLTALSRTFSIHPVG